MHRSFTPGNERQLQLNERDLDAATTRSEAALRAAAPGEVRAEGRCNSHNVARGVSVDADRVTLELKAGENQLLLKIYNQGGGHGFSFSTQAAQDGGLAAIWQQLEKDFPMYAARMTLPGFSKRSKRSSRRWTSSSRTRGPRYLTSSNRPWTYPWRIGI